MNRSPVLACATLVSVFGAGSALAAPYTVTPTDDVELDLNQASINLNSGGVEFEPADAAGQEGRLTINSGASIATGARPEIIAFRWDAFGVGAGETVVGDGVFSLYSYSAFAAPSNDFTVHEITGGAASWDETTVTVEDLLNGAADINAIIGASLGVGVATASTWTAVTIPEATIQRLIDGTSSGLLIQQYNPGTGGFVNAGFRSHTWFDTTLRPTLAFETAVPEPASFALIGLGALGLLRRCR